jgi:hypothetical protein
MNSLLYQGSDPDSDSDILSDNESEYILDLNKPDWSLKKLEIINKEQSLYLCDAIKVIESIPVWDKQRILSETQVKEILEFQLNYYKENKTFNFIGPFYICSIDNKDYRIIDGQHRLVTIHRLITKYKFKSFNILVWLINVENEDQRYQIFRNINSAKPISLPDLYLDKTSNIINECCLKLYNDYPKFFQNTSLKKVHRPNLKIDLLKNNLFEKNIVSILKIESAEELNNYIITMNNYYLKKDDTYFPKIRNTNTKNIILRAMKKGKLLLGLFPNYEWIDQIIEFNLFNQDVDNKINNASKSLEENENIFKPETPNHDLENINNIVETPRYELENINNIVETPRYELENINVEPTKIEVNISPVSNEENNKNSNFKVIKFNK